MRKTYEAPNTILSNICVFVNKRPVDISFVPVSAFEGARTGKGSMLVTEDEEIQRAIEASPYFHSEVWLYKEEKTEEDIKKEAEQIEYEHISVDSPTEARDYLANRFGIDKKKILNMKQIISAATKVGIIFDGI